MRGCLALMAFLFLASAAFAEDDTEQEIDYLLNSVASSDCVFIRNGKEHGPEAARDHLNLKRRRGKRYYTTADEYIEKLASSSSWSGKPYFIRCGDSAQQPAGEWFMAVLLEYRSKQ
jgi:hypothetical protein